MVYFLYFSVERWLLPPRRSKKRKGPAWPNKLTLHYARNNYVSVGFFSLFLCLQLAVFLSRMATESQKHRNLERSIEQYWVNYNTLQRHALAGHNLTRELGFVGEGSEVEWRASPPSMGLHSGYELVAREFGEYVL